LAVASWLYSTSAKCGQLRAFEREEDLKNLVMKGKNLKAKQKSSKADEEMNATSIDDGKGGRILY